MKRFNKKFYKKMSPTPSNLELVAFYKMLLKFEKRHPDFSAIKMMKKLYPTLDLESIL